MVADEAEDDTDPMTQAMRSAEKLDRETESLHPGSEDDASATHTPPRMRPRSMSLPLYCHLEYLDDATPFYVFGNTAGWDDGSVYDEAVVEEDEAENFPAATSKNGGRNASKLTVDIAAAGNLHAYDHISRENHQLLFTPRTPRTPRSPSCVGETYGRHSLYSHSATPNHHHHNATVTTRTEDDGTFLYSSRPTSSSQSERASPRTPGRMHRRARSMDRICFAESVRDRHMAVVDAMKAVVLADEGRQRDALDGGRQGKCRPYSCMTGGPRSTTPAFVRANTHLLKRIQDLRAAKAARPASYVDRGTDAADLSLNESHVAARRPEPAREPFRPVLPLLEDLVIHFTDDTPDLLLETIIQGFKEGTYPVMQAPLTAAATDGDEPADCPSTPGTHRSAVFDEMDADDATAGDDDANHHTVPGYDPDEYDPFAVHGNFGYPQPTWTAPKAAAKPRQPQPRMAVASTHLALPGRNREPPTPAQTPPPQPALRPAVVVSEDLDRKFHYFSTTHCHTAVSIQNSLRSVLKCYFPSENTGYHQFHFPLLPELDGFWKPIFREAVESGSPTGTARNSDSSNLRDHRRRMDLILAMGAQRGVGKAFLSSVTGQLERLGTKPNGISRSGRLDLRYLIANAMQSFTAQPLANQTQDNPFTNNMLLATLIIPHLETYLAAHGEIRFLLLEYPAEHLSTVLAMQRLIGVDLFKVAGIVDAESGEPTSFSRLRSPSASTHSLPRTNSRAASATGPVGSSLRSPVGSIVRAGQATMVTIQRTASSASLSARGRSSTSSNNDNPLNPSFSRANFLITSAATEAEIAHFVSTIFGILMRADDFYVPDGPVPSRTGSISIGAPASLLNLHSSLSISSPVPTANASTNTSGRDSPSPPPTVTNTAATTPTSRKKAPSSVDVAAAKNARPHAPLSPFPRTDPPLHGNPYLPPAPPTPGDMTSPPLSPAPHPSSLQYQHSKLAHQQQQQYKGYQQPDYQRPLPARPVSPAPSAKSSATNRTRRTFRTAGRAGTAASIVNGGVGGDDAVSFYDVDFDSDYEAEERMYMPMYMRRAPPRKANSRKALKWLGLA